MKKFMFTTGVENSYPVIKTPDGKRKRIDEMEMCRHYENWRTDFRLCKDLGIDTLRYGPPLYKSHLGPDRYDWDFSDETFHDLDELGISPIADLCHFGVPDWIGDYRNPDFPRLFADYARAFAKRFPKVRLYTPVNEIYVAASFSGLKGFWNECESSDRGFVTAIKHLCKADVLAMHAIREVNPEAIFVQSESSEYYHAQHPDAQPRADFYNQRRFLALDLVYGHRVCAEVYQYLLDNGMTKDDYSWFRENAIIGNCIMGNDYYGWNEHMIHSDGSDSQSGAIFGYYVITKQYFDRYRLPVMHTETNLMDSEKAPGWLQKEWSNVRQLRRDGVPILGFTWYSLTDQIDWNCGLHCDSGTVNPCGLYDLDRKIRPVGSAYRDLIKDWESTVSRESREIVIGE